MTTEEKFSKALYLMSGVGSSSTSAYSYFYGLLQQKAVDDEEVTMRLNTVDGVRATLEYNPKWLEQIDETMLASLITIELNRLLLRHCTSRKQPDEKLNYFSSTIVCCDQSNCSYMNFSKEASKLIKEMPTDTRSDIKKLLGEDYNPDTDKYLEKIYSLLAPKAKQCTGSSGAEGEGQGQSSKSGSGEDKNDAKGALAKHFDPNNGPTQTAKWGQNSIVDAEVGQRVRQCDAKTWGSMPGNLRDKIMAANALLIDPSIVLRNFIATAFSNSMMDTRMKMPRRHPDMIGKMPGRRHGQDFKLLVAADASGSMGQANLEKCVCVLNQMVRKDTQVDFCWWDCECQKPVSIGKRTFEMDGTGGGGTDPSCILKMLTENNLSYDGIIVITDCGFNWDKPTGKYATKIFVIRTPDAVEAPSWVGNKVLTMKDIDVILKK